MEAMKKHISKVIVACSVVASGCTSVDVVPGPSMDAIWAGSANGGVSSVDAIRQGIEVDPMQVGAEPVYPMVRAATVLPVWEVGETVGEYIKTDGRWIYEIVDPGGFVE